MMDLGKGELLGERYEVDEPIGFGGAGDVYRVVDTKDGATVALKLLYEDRLATEVLRERFLTEAKIMEDLRHPNVVPVYAVGEHRERVYFVMEYAPLGSVRELFFGGEGEQRDAVDVVLQVLSALSFAHRSGCIHRDVKPANVLRFENGVVKLADFGVARYDVIGIARHTKTGDYLGTLGYMSPEQRADPRSVEPPSDLYAVGAMLYTLLARLSRPPPDLYALAIDADRLPGVHPAVCDVVERATRSRVGDRFPDADAMHAALSNARFLGWK